MINISLKFQNSGTATERNYVPFALLFIHGKKNAKQYKVGYLPDNSTILEC